MCGAFSPYWPDLQHWLGILQLIQFWYYLPGVSIQILQVTGCVPWDWPPQFRCLLHNPGCHLYFWLTGYKSGSRNPLPRFNNLLEWNTGASVELGHTTLLASPTRKVSEPHTLRIFTEVSCRQYWWSTHPPVPLPSREVSGSEAGGSNPLITWLLPLATSPPL